MTAVIEQGITQLQFATPMSFPVSTLASASTSAGRATKTKTVPTEAMRMKRCAADKQMFAGIT